MVTCIELTGEAKILASHSFKYLEVFFTVGLLPGPGLGRELDPAIAGGSSQASRV